MKSILYFVFVLGSVTQHASVHTFVKPLVLVEHFVALDLIILTSFFLHL